MIQVTNRQTSMLSQSKALPSAEKSEGTVQTQQPEEKGAGPAAVFTPSTEAKGLMTQAASAEDAQQASDDASSSAQPVASDSDDEKHVKTYSSSEKADKEIAKLKEKQQELEAKLDRTSDSAQQTKLQKEIDAVKQELSQKDTESYRRENATFWESEI